ncbi:MAG: ABC transporter permease [Spirochaetales bacterium]|jgi:simple sugar transport system permease protein|nr:ABC transporter permease [Spirochaetales bacterium]
MNTSIMVNFLFKGLEMSCPIAFAALGGVFSEKSGVINIALEGFMIVTAFSVVWGAVAFQTIWMGMVFALVAGVLMSLIHAVATITFRVNQIVSGVAINILAVGVGRFLSERVFGQETQSAINPFLFPTVMGINSFAFALIPIAIISWFVLYKTVFGLRLRTVGESPEAADTLGINVYVMRYAGVMLSGLMVGFAGATLYPTKWVNGMTGGRGFIALACMIFGRWHPIGAVLAALLFGYADTFRIMFETMIPIPSQFVMMTPYVLAVVVLAGMVGRARPPAADGIPYEPGE